MTFDFTAYSLISLILALVGAYLACMVYSRRPAPGARPFTWFIVAVSIWIILRFLQSGAEVYTTKIGMAVMMYWFIAAAAIFWVAFTLDYSGKSLWKRPKFYIYAFLIPAISLLLLLLASLWEGLEFFRITPSYDQSGQLLLWRKGFLFWLQFVYLLVLMAAGNIILWRHLRRTQSVLFKQITILIVAMAVPIIAMVLFSIGLGYYKGLDVVPFSLIFAIGVFVWIFFRYRFIELVPAARGALIESLPDGVIILDNQATIVDLNPTSRKLLIAADKPAIGRKLNDVWPQLDLLSSSLKSNQRAEMPVGGIYLDVSRTAFQDRKGSTVGNLLILRDVTERRRNEQTIKDSEIRYSTLVEQSNELVFIMQKGVISFANSRIKEILGFEIQEVIGKPLEFLVADADKALVLKRHENRQSNKAEPKIYEILMRCKNEKLRIVEFSVGQIVFGGQPADIVTVRDITERKQTQKQLEDLYNQEKVLRSNLQDEIEKRSKYTRALVHELNTPLTSILASGELLESEVEGKLLSALVKNIRRASFNLKQRIDELIELARGEVGMLKINAMPVEIARVLEEIVSEMEPLAESKGLQMDLEIGDGVGLVLGDRGRLRQVMSNLLSNAIKFTEKGRIEVLVADRAEEIEIQVRDSGRGMSAEQMENLFDPYRRKMNEGQELGGLGIGLALSKMFVDLHKGTIKVESTLRKGTIFTFTVPKYVE
jgi:PAS domain S-box-containing protein